MTNKERARLLATAFTGVNSVTNSLPGAGLVEDAKRRLMAELDDIAIRLRNLAVYFDTHAKEGDPP